MNTRKFADFMDENARWTLTENGQPALRTTGDALVNLFGVIGSLRTRPQDVDALFCDAFNENPLLALKMAFYARDVRGGLGERETARIIFRRLALSAPDVMIKNLHLIPLFGRWDDLYSIVGVGNSVEDAVWEFVSDQLGEDIFNASEGGRVSLLAKWLKSENASSPDTRELAKITRERLGMSPRNYRRILSDLRAEIGIVEAKMSANEWEEIKYSEVPSKAMANYRRAFGRHDADGFGTYLESVEKGEEKINSSTLYPYDIFEKMGFGFPSRYANCGSYFYFASPDKALELQWNALPNYVKDGDNILIVADTSSSMGGRPICTALGLAVYFAERNTGQFHNKFITFSAIPSWVTISGNNLSEKIAHIPSIIENTDLEAVFDLILGVALKNNIPQEEMPKALVIISDGEFDDTGDVDRTFYKTMSAKYASHDYALPKIISWNVDSRQAVYHAEANENGIILVSGQSPSVFKSICKGISQTPYDAMAEILNNPRYDVVTI